MTRIRLIAVAAVIACAAAAGGGGCKTEHVQAYAERRFALDRQRPTNAEFGVTLVRVEGDGTVVYEHEGATRASKPSNTLVTELRAVKSDPAKQSATMGVFGVWNLSEEYFGPFLLSRKYE